MNTNVATVLGGGAALAVGAGVGTGFNLIQNRQDYATATYGDGRVEEIPIEVDRQPAGFGKTLLWGAGGAALVGAIVGMKSESLRGAAIGAALGAGLFGAGALTRHWEP